ncbi:nicotinate-nucleotide--dimethylbenzimidazole phosphoribosyltransferase [Obelidium mucronatum]|nr:nicotinate-nucleotide--dimethylbenzimidazole phosphoribosyltransferase [Obelidium mucronatum]
MEDYPTWVAKAQAEIDNKTKPPGSLGRLEEWSVRLMALQRTLKPTVSSGRILLFAADHGIADDGVSQFPKVVTREMLRNLGSGGAAINAICNSNGLDLSVIDVGVDTEETFPGVFVDKVFAPHGSLSSLTHECALSKEQLDAALETGIKFANDAIRGGVDVIGIGELGIGNTAVAAILLSAASGKSAAQVTGKGTGVEGERYTHKISIVDSVVTKNKEVIDAGDWREIFCHIGGLEIASMVGASIAVARSQKTALIVDGFISMVAFLYAAKLFPEDTHLLAQCAFFSHTSAESGTQIAIETIEDALHMTQGTLKPMLDIGFRLGEGTGAALAYPILKAAAHVASDMNTFAGAGVSGSN